MAAQSSSSRSRRNGDPSALTVRPASLSDAETIVRFRLALLREHDGHAIYGKLRFDAAERLRRSTALQLASGRQITYLTLRGRTPVGMLRCIEAKGSPLLVPSRYAYIASAYVVPAHRKRGVMNRLLDAAITWALARDITELRLHATPENAAANATWEQLGFSTVELLKRKEIGRAGA